MPNDVSEIPATMEDVLQEVSRIKDMVKDAVDDGVRSATRGLKRSRYAAEDALDEARHTVKQYPLEAMGVAFGAGVLLGGLACLIFRRR